MSWTKIADVSSALSKVVTIDNGYIPTGLLLYLASEDDKYMMEEDLEIYLLVRDYNNTYSGVANTVPSYIGVSDVSSSYTKVANV
jgi:hypothetical protein